MGVWASKEAFGHALTEDLGPFPQIGKKLRKDAQVEEEYHLGKILGRGAFSRVQLAIHLDTGDQYACKVLLLPQPPPPKNAHADQQCGPAGAGGTQEAHSTPASIKGAPPKGMHAAQGEAHPQPEQEEREEAAYAEAFAAMRAMIMREVGVLLDLQHPCVVGLKEYFVRQDGVFLIMELLPGGHLLDTLIAHGAYEEGEARTAFRQLITGVQYLHSRGIVHRDIKPDNLLLSKPGDIGSFKIADFGFARQQSKADEPDSLDGMKTVLGTPEYMAPELIRALPQYGGGTYGPEVDLWSCGVVLYMLLSSTPPFFNANEDRLLSSILEGQYDFEGPEWRHVCDDAKDLISKLLAVDPGERLTCGAALQHPWMTAGSAAEHPSLLQQQSGGELQAWGSVAHAALLLGRFSGALTSVMQGLLGSSGMGGYMPGWAGPSPVEPSGASVPDGGIPPGGFWSSSWWPAAQQAQQAPKETQSAVGKEAHASADTLPGTTEEAAEGGAVSQEMTPVARQRRQASPRQPSD